MTPMWELRNDVREMLEFDRKEHEQYKRPFRKHELHRAYFALTSKKLGKSKSIGHLRYHLLKEVPGCERDALESASPLRKDEIKALLDALKEAAS